MLDLNINAKNILVKIAKHVGHPIHPYDVHDLKEKAYFDNDKVLMDLIYEWYYCDKIETQQELGNKYKVDWMNKLYG